MTRSDNDENNQIKTNGRRVKKEKLKQIMIRQNRQWVHLAISIGSGMKRGFQDRTASQPLILHSGRIYAHPPSDVSFLSMPAFHPSQRRALPSLPAHHPCLYSRKRYERKTSLSTLSRWWKTFLAAGMRRRQVRACLWHGQMEGRREAKRKGDRVENRTWRIRQQHQLGGLAACSGLRHFWPWQGGTLRTKQTNRQQTSL